MFLSELLMLIEIFLLTTVLKLYSIIYTIIHNLQNIEKLKVTQTKVVFKRINSSKSEFLHQFLIEIIYYLWHYLWHHYSISATNILQLRG